MNLIEENQDDAFLTVSGHGRVLSAIHICTEFRLADSRTPDQIASKLNELAGSNSMIFTCNDIPSHPASGHGVRVYRISARYLGTAHKSDVNRRFHQLVNNDLARADADMVTTEQRVHNA